MVRHDQASLKIQPISSRLLLRIDNILLHQVISSDASVKTRHICGIWRSRAAYTCIRYPRPLETVQQDEEGCLRGIWSLPHDICNMSVG